MSSEIIVVLVLTVIAVGFVVWIRMNSRDHEEGVQGTNPADETTSKEG
jgi:hypothetical protein